MKTYRIGSLFVLISGMLALGAASLVLADTSASSSGTAIVGYPVPAIDVIPMTLTWQAHNAASCNTSGFSPGSETSGSVSIDPSANGMYTVTCTGPGGSTITTINVSESSESTVNGATAASSTDDTFAVGMHVETTSDVNVHSDPTLGDNVACMQPAGSTGTIVDGPQTYHGYIWWQLSFGSCVGWSVQDYLWPMVPPPVASSQTASAVEAAPKLPGLQTQLHGVLQQILQLLQGQ